MTGIADSDTALFELCQRSMALSLRRESDAAFALLESATEEMAQAQATPQAVRQVGDAIYIAARWSGDFVRGESALRSLAEVTQDPTTRGWITVRLAHLTAPTDSRRVAQSAMGEFAVAGDDAGQAMSMLFMSFPKGDLLPSVEVRLELVEAARAVGERLGDATILARAGNVRAALLAYAGDPEAAIASYSEVWERFHMGSPLLSTEAGTAAMNHCLCLLSWGRHREVDDILSRSEHIVTGPRLHDWYDLVRATALVHQGKFRAALTVLDSLREPTQDLAAYVTALRVASEIQISAKLPTVDLASECELLELHSMQLGCTARLVQAELRAARGEPRPHRDLVLALQRLIPSRLRFGWDGAALTLAKMAPDEARAVLADMWDFWPAGPGPAIRRRFTEALVGIRETYPSLMEVAEEFEAAGDPMSAASALTYAARQAPTGSDALLATRRAIDLYEHTDAERSIAAVLRERRIRREPGAPTIPSSQRYAVNSGLTPREREVAALAADGLTAREIAAALTLSAGTVRNHLLHAREKLGGIPKREFSKFK